MDDKHETVKLNYTIHKYSSYSANYVPENIMVNKPVDQLSRWFTDSSTPHQFIMLKLNSPAIVETIKFGKFIKAHVSDLKKFQVFGGTEENNLSLLLSAGLKKDNSPEIFRLRHRTIEGLYLPIQYIKIVPLQSWGPAYNYTIWYVELEGMDHIDLINSALDTINLRKEEEAVRILLKHLRRRRYKDAFEALSRESGVKLEGPVQTRLWNALVESGDYKRAEEIFEEGLKEGELDWYMSWQPYTPVWRLLSPCSPAVEAALCCERSSPLPRRATTHLNATSQQPQPAPAGEEAANGGGGEETEDPCYTCCSSNCDKPGPRGGHQLVVDSSTGTLYLFGGWNGTEDLDDLWSYDTMAERWSLLCAHSGQAGGPSPRSCHKMVFDPVHRRLFTLGRYLDNAQRVPANMISELHVYDVATGSWRLACGDTAAAGGPQLVFDHQMCIDPDTQTIYVFGGRVLPANTEEVVSPQYSGLYAYYVATNSWQLLLPDKHELAAPQPRVSHSMLFHPVQRRLYMFAGQRNKEQLVDLWWWEPGGGGAGGAGGAGGGAGACGALCAAPARAPPAAGATQRATLDPDADEMYLLSGMSKEKDKKVYNTLWVFSFRRRTWACVYRNERVAPHEPRPRFAHQLVYDPRAKVHYLFGGNPGNQACPRLRLDDLWSLKLTKPTLEDVFRTARATIREACYRELCLTGRELEAVDYLRNEMREALDHSDPDQVARFQKLATVLFVRGERGCAGGAAGAAGALSPRRARHLARRRAAAPRTPHLAHAMQAVLGAEDTLPDPVEPFEDFTAPTPETWDVGEDADDEPPSLEWDARAARIELYDRLCQYYRRSVVPPPGDVGDLVTL